jgi:hypothetical protein
MAGVDAAEVAEVVQVAELAEAEVAADKAILVPVAAAFVVS